jgi:hypothetical protein
MMKRLALVMATGGAVFFALYELGRRWRATPDEVRRPMAGDDIVSRPKYQTEQKHG